MHRRKATRGPAPRATVGIALFDACLETVPGFAPDARKINVRTE
jgi:hypothetical protein